MMLKCARLIKLPNTHTLAEKLELMWMGTKCSNGALTEVLSLWVSHYIVTMKRHQGFKATYRIHIKYIEHIHVHADNCCCSPVGFFFFWIWFHWLTKKQNKKWCCDVLLVLFLAYIDTYMVSLLKLYQSTINTLLLFQKPPKSPLKYFQSGF